MLDHNKILGREYGLFDKDILAYEEKLTEIVQSSKFLVLGGAGSIGQAVVKEIFRRNPSGIHVVDINENNLAELVRDIRSSFGYIDGEFKTFCLDIASQEYSTFISNDGNYDYVMNLSALKHVRSEKDPFTLMRMVEVNILNTIKTIEQSNLKSVSKYFCVSTDKAANPVNMMGASKKIMEMFLYQHSKSIPISTARFANVAFSDGSLLHSFGNRIQKNQPLVAPNDVQRYFITSKEAGELCLMSCLLGENKDIFFPMVSEDFNLIKLTKIAEIYLDYLSLKPFLCDSEEEARYYFQNSPKKGYWPCFFSKSDTTGEKEYEEFYEHGDILDLKKFYGVGIVKNKMLSDESVLSDFVKEIDNLKQSEFWSREQIIDLFKTTLQDFDHKDTGKFLDEKM